ncbi:MAG: alpha-L-fucosidase [Armatimonadetes bacterium]|nr:alpha-L-fucosidase [Candidatus Hippobium faecium]
MKDWWNNAGLGMMVHFGVYSVLAGEYKGIKAKSTGEWIQSYFQIPNKDYTEIAKTFNPVNFDADQWMKTASEAGIKFIVFTSKHHEGFCNFKTDYSDYSLWNYQKRDLVAELAEACKKYDVKLCLYYSHCLDWHEKNGGGWLKPDLNYGMYWGNVWDFPNTEKKDFDIYLHEKSIPQIKELLTNYGDISMMWFDCPMDMTPERAKIVYDTVKSIQPECMVNCRNCIDPYQYSDFFGLSDNSVAGKISENKTESIITLNDTWGYNRHDLNWKSTDTVIDLLNKCASVNSNLSINVGPKADGTWPEETTEIFKGLAEWMAVNKESIHNNRAIAAPINCEDYLVTQKSNKIYIHFIKDVKNIEIVHIKSKVASWKVLGNVYKASFSQETEPDTGLSVIRISAEGKTKNTVIELTFDETPQFVSEIIEQNDAIVLPTAHGKINVNGELNADIQKKIGAYGEVYDTKIEVDQQGCLVNWYDTANYISWDFIAREKGKYKATLVTGAVYHMATWYGGHIVNINMNDTKYPSYEVINDGFIKEAGEIYKQAKTELGEIEIDKTGKNTLSLTASKLIKENTPGLAVIKLILTKI